jgi:hypothetical protein
MTDPLARPIAERSLMVRDCARAGCAISVVLPHPPNVPARRQLTFSATMP